MTPQEFEKRLNNIEAAQAQLAELIYSVARNTGSKSLAESLKSDYKELFK